MVLDDTMLPCPGDPDWPVVLRLDEAETHLDRMRHYQPDILVEHRGAEDANIHLRQGNRPCLVEAHVGVA